MTPEGRALDPEDVKQKGREYATLIAACMEKPTRTERFAALMYIYRKLEGNETERALLYSALALFFARLPGIPPKLPED